MNWLVLLSIGMTEEISYIVCNLDNIIHMTSRLSTYAYCYWCIKLMKSQASPAIHRYVSYIGQL